jgi:hypothetical protein
MNAMTETATTVEMDNAGFSELKDQILNQHTDQKDKPVEQKTTKPVGSRQDPNRNKMFFKKGDQSVEVDDDYELEFMADKRPTKLTLREMKERAAGDIAIKNRMHALAEEKKKVQGTFKEFTTLARMDPLKALEYISNKAKETDSEFEFNKYLETLADQAEKLGKMDPKERKAWELERKLDKAEQDLSQSQRREAVVQRKQELLSEYPQIGDSQFGQMVDAVLSNEELVQGLENEHDVMDTVEALIQETLTQKDIISVIRDIDADYVNDNELIFSLSDQIRQNPDFDEEDVRDIVRSILQPERRLERPSSSPERNQDIRTLSKKARAAAPVGQLTHTSDPYELLKAQLLERKHEINKTPKTMR